MNGGIKTNICVAFLSLGHRLILYPWALPVHKLFFRNLEQLPLSPSRSGRHPKGPGLRAEHKLAHCPLSPHGTIYTIQVWHSALHHPASLLGPVPLSLSESFLTFGLCLLSSSDPGDATPNGCHMQEVCDWGLCFPGLSLMGVRTASITQVLPDLNLQNSVLMKPPFYLTSPHHQCLLWQQRALCDTVLCTLCMLYKY